MTDFLSRRGREGDTHLSAKSDPGSASNHFAPRLALLSAILAAPFTAAFGLLIHNSFGLLVFGFSDACPATFITLAWLGVAILVHELVLFVPRSLVIHLTHAREFPVWIAVHVPGAILTVLASYVLFDLVVARCI